MKKLSSLKKLSATFAVILLIVATTANMIQNAYPESTNVDVSNTNRLVQEATSLIEENQILIENRKLSNYVAIGTVKKVESIILDDKTGNVVTNAEICVDAPLTKNIQTNDVITVRYVGGSVDNMTLWVRVNWAYAAEDTVRLPSEFNLETGATIMFFAKEEDDHTKLLTYVPFSIDSVNKSSNQGTDESDVSTRSETQPSTTVNEANGYGFEWVGIH